MGKVLFVVLAAAVLATGCGATGRYGLPIVPGFEAASVVAANQAMVASIAGQQGWIPYGQPYYGQYGNVPVCRPQDIPPGMPPVSQPVVVRVDKTKKHQAKDIVGGAAIGAGLGYIVYGGSPKAAAAGTGAGAGGGLLVANHEQEFCLLLPAKMP